MSIFAPMTQDMSPPPLEGVRVLDFSQNLPGPYATFLLSGWGADVVKVEPPKGDPGRFMEPFFSMVNRDKRSVVLDLRDAASRPALEALVRWADVLVEGFRPGVMARLGCGPEEARALNERLIYCSISAFGQEGPLRDHPGHDLDLQAFSGVCHLERDARGRAGVSMLPIADLSSSLLALSSISAALAARERTGRGATLDVAMADGVLSWASVWGRGVDLRKNAERQLPGGLARRLARPLLERLGRLKLYAMPHYGVFECRDRRWLSVGIVDEGHFWEALTDELGLARFGAMKLPARIAASPLLRPLVARAIRAQPRAHWVERFGVRGIPSSPVHRPEDASAHPQVRARGFVDERGWMGSPLPGARLPRSAAPARGQHTAEMLEALGVAPDPELR